MKKNLKILLASGLILLIGLLVVLKFTSKPKNPDHLSVVATNFPAYDFARAIVGDQADVKMLIKPGAETHDFEPTPSDIIDIKNSELFIFTGGESDEWVESILKDVDLEKTKLFKMMDAVDLVEEELVEGMEPEEEEGEEEDEVEYDEHVWTSLKNATKIIDRLKTELSTLSPDNQALFEENAKNYTKKLLDLDSEFEKISKSGLRNTLVFGDRFPLRYFVDDYNLSYFAAFPGCSEQTEASSKTVAFLIDKIKAEKIPVVLKIEMGNGDLASTIAEETGAKVLTFNSAHTISADDFKNGLTYAKIMEGNLNVLKEALN